MYDYMKALQERFDEKQPEHLAGELGTPYSFDADEEEKAKEMITNG